MEIIRDNKLYFVGGVVRDELLNVPSIDIDYCYEGNAIEFAKRYEILKINEKFGTVRIIYNNREIDIASTRTETYPKKGHLPKVSNIGCPLEQDLSRRDFTINAIAKRTTDGKIFDYFDGQNDIKNKILRILHKNSFIDDPTRIIRGLKFSVRFGFELDDETKKIQDEYLSNINYDISYSRLKKELKDAFSLNKAEVFNRFLKQKMYKLLSPKQKEPLIIGEQIEQYLRNFQSNHVWLIYLSFFDLSKIELTRQEKKIIEWANRLEREKLSNNTPQESIIVYNLRNQKC